MSSFNKTAYKKTDINPNVAQILKTSLEYMGLNKGVKMAPVATLLGAQHYKASTVFSSPNKYCTTNIATLTTNF